MTLLSLLIIVLIVPAFIGGWFGGYKKACDAHGGTSPASIGTRRGEHINLDEPARRSIYSSRASFGGSFPSSGLSENSIWAHK